MATASTRPGPLQPANGDSPKYWYNPITDSFTDEDGNPAPIGQMEDLQSSKIFQRTLSKALDYFPKVSTVDPASGNDKIGEQGWGEGAAGGE